MTTLSNLVSSENWTSATDHFSPKMYFPFLAAFPIPFTGDDAENLIGPAVVIIFVILIWLFATLGGIKLLIQYSAARKLLVRLGKEPELFSPNHIGLARFASQSSTKGNFAKAARDLDAYKSPAEVRELVSQVAVREDSRTAAAFLSFAVGSVLILGLMGTFIAFAELVSSSDLKGDALQQGIRNVLAHLNIAFSASIVGVGTSIFLLFLSTVFVRPRRQLLLADFEELLVAAHFDSVRTGLAAMEGTESGDLFETLCKLSENLSRAVDSIQTVATRFDSISTSTPEAIAETLEAVRQEIASGSVRYAELVTTASATKDAVEGISTEAAKVLGEMLKEHGERQLEVYAKAETFSQALLNDIGERDAERLVSYREGISGVADKVAILALGWETKSKELVTAFQTERTDYINHLKEANQLSATTFERAAKNSLAAVEKISANMTESCCKVAAEAVLRLEAAYQAGIADWTQTTEIAKLQNKTVKETLGILDNRLAPLASSLGELQNGTTQTMNEAGKAASRLAEIPVQLDSIIASHTEGASTLAKEAASMSTTIRNLGSDANGVFEKAGKNLNLLSIQLDNLIEIGNQRGLNPKPPKGERITSWMKRLFSKR